MVTSIKLEKDWDPKEDEAAIGDSRALNAIYNVVDKNIFRLIKTCESAKEACEILEGAHEGTTKVRSSRLQLLTTRFEAMNMLEVTTIAEFNVSISDVANESFSLGVSISDENLVRKIPRSLP